MTASLSIVDTFLLEYAWLEQDERLVGIGQGVGGPGFEDGPGILILCEVGAKAELSTLVGPTWNNMPVVINESGRFELDYDALAERLTDPALEVRSANAVLTGDAAAAEGRRVLGTDEGLS